MKTITVRKQQTLADKITYKGIGLHSGQDVSLTMYPAADNTGIRFLRTDVKGAQEIVACVSNVTSTMRATTLSNKLGQNVFTVEHLLSALNMLEVDNCLVEMSAPEPPVADGSAVTYVDLINSVGVQQGQADLKALKIDKAIGVYEEDRYICLVPYDGLRVSFTSINTHPLLGVQYFDAELDRQTFIEDIAPARTIGFVHEIEMLKKMGLGLGGSLENVVVYDEKTVLTPLRFADELVRHKILDILGDLSLVGKFYGHIIAVKSSHSLNTQLAKKLHSFMQA